MQRRLFLSLPAARLSAAQTSKRERMLRWLDGKPEPGYTPAAFFLHFDPAFKNGLPAAERHLEFFRHTDMDFVKIQFEQTYQRQDFLQKPQDWSRLALRKIDFYEPLLVTVRELVRKAKRDALVLMTLYSPYMSAGQCATPALLKQHLKENPDAVKRGLEILSESQLIFVRACIQAGVDGFYMSTQGGEAANFGASKIFTDYIKPFDLAAMKEIQSRCLFNILHVCDYAAPYADYSAVRDYPGHIVNCNTRLAKGEMTPKEIAAWFGRPYMGGLDRHGVLVKGAPAEVEAEIRRVIGAAPRQFILAADCTVDSATSWDRLRHAIEVAHRTGS